MGWEDDDGSGSESGGWGCCWCGGRLSLLPKGEAEASNPLSSSGGEKGLDG